MIEISKTQTRRIYFIGILSNIDDSILDFKFDKGLKATFMYKFEEFLSEMSGIKLEEVKRRLEQKRFNSFYLSSSFEINFGDNADYIKSFEFAQAVVDYNNDIMSYLQPLFRKMRLYKTGNIMLTDHYFYTMDNNEAKLYHDTLNDEFFILEELYHIKNDELYDLKQFIEYIDLNFDEKDEEFLKLSFGNFEQSYHIENLHLSFLSLMNGVEALLHPSSNGEITYRISRYVAILIGKNKNDSEKIFHRMKKLYNERSKIVHTGKAKLSEEDETKLREYLRESIKEINKIIKNKDVLFGEDGKIKLDKLQNQKTMKNKILYTLDTCGFGERPWRQIDF